MGIYSEGSSNAITYTAVLIGIISVYVGTKYLTALKKRRILKKWNRAPKDLVILHGMYGGKVLPTPSPFVLKLETYLRMAQIPYEIDKTDIWGPKGKTPFVSLNGQHIGDSQMIVEFLGKKFEKNLDMNYSDEERAIGTAVRIMLEEYVYWGGLLWRFKYGGRDTFKKVREGNISFGEWLIFKMIAPSLLSMAWSQGLGRHSEEEVLELMEKSLRAVSKILGRKKFLLGEKPCSDDCAAFGILASPVFMPDSPFEKLFADELKNINDYCIRMKEEFWPDWDKYLS